MKLPELPKVKIHVIVEDGIDTHSGKYWYKCSECQASDWIASYGTKEQLNFWFKPCKEQYEATIAT